MHLLVGTLWKHSDDYHRNSCLSLWGIHSSRVKQKLSQQYKLCNSYEGEEGVIGAVIERTSEMYFR